MKKIITLFALIVLMYNSNAQIVITAGNSSTSICAGYCGGFLYPVVTGGTAPYAYSWNTGSALPFLDSICAGTYTLTVTDSLGVTANASFTITHQAPIVVTVGTIVPVSCYGAADGSVTITATGGLAPYTYQNYNSNSNSLENLAAGTYTIYVIDANGCSAYTNITITQPPYFGSNLSSFTSSDPGACNGSATITTIGGAVPYSYHWSNGQATSTASNLCNQTYTVTVVDANNCKTVLNITDSLNTPDTTICHADFSWQYNPTTNNIQFTDLSANGTTSWAWNFNGVTSTTSNLQNPIFQTDTATSFYVCLIAYNSNVNCYDSICKIINLNQNVNPCHADFSWQYNPTTNNIQFTDLSASGTTSWTWNFNGVTSTTSNLQNPVFLTDTATSFYVCLTVYNSNANCYDSICKIINLNETVNPCHADFTWQYNSANHNIQFTDLSASGTTSWTWKFYGQSTTIESNLQNPVLYLSDTVVYYQICLIAYNSNSNCYDSICKIINLNDSAPCSNLFIQYDAIIDNGNNPGNNDGSIQITVFGGFAPYSYLWSNGVTTEDIYNLVEGYYSVQVTDANGCSTNSTVYINNINNYIINDTIYNTPVDTCFSFPVVDAYVYSYDMIDSTIVSVVWAYVDASGNVAFLTEEYEIDAEGNYMVSSSINCNTGNKAVTIYTGIIHIDFEAMLGIEQPQIFNAIKLYPNPITDQLNIQLNLIEKGDITISIINAVGQVIIQKSENLSSGSQELKINTNELKAGLYLIHLNDDKGNFITRKLIK